MKKILDDWRETLDVWKSGQTQLPSVVRWSKYIDKDQGARKQDSLQHSYSLSVLGVLMLARLRRQGMLDEVLVLTALLLHDHGEGEIGKDTLYVDKSTEGDLAEYLAFRARYGRLSPEEFTFVHRAFLLQFALKDPPEFPEDARAIMRCLRLDHRADCLAFDALERWDYVLYALEQYAERGNEKILVQTLRNQLPKLDLLARDLPGFRQAVWTDETAADARAFLARFDGQWIESKGET